MNPFSRDELQSLLDTPRGPRISIYLPTHRASGDIMQGAIRLKNLVRETEQQLAAAGVGTAAAADLLVPVRRLVDERPFWQEQSDGLAIFRSPALFRYYRLPLVFPELALAAERFHFKPLLPWLGGSPEYWLLTLSQNRVRLYQGTAHSLVPAELPGAPQSLAEALRFDEFEQQLQSYGGGAAAGRRSSVFYGHGGAGEDPKDQLFRYFRLVDRGVRDVLKDRRQPLVLAGVEFLLPIYREANTYPLLVVGGVPGNPDATPPQELHERSWALAAPHFARTRTDAARRYRELMGTGRTANLPAEVAAAAYHGRVDCLFVGAGLRQWGTFTPAAGRAELHEAPQPGDEDLLDFAAIHTYLNGGTVHVVLPEEVPDLAPLAAVFRY